eukprot:CAMPEP_0116029262 /NCGR_PEP_ID=MMETSP0321-20121206/16037_1 /TAXON_ID=163516 /ORGANISM="Leptocylindrus danicus var. danicus, Strain B650" /LENGTH=370 /DNA_ID=CAMNT_0003503609 /DNA_START=116 /DNA_END=1225 /DNA_ORIENTATION=+
MRLFNALISIVALQTSSVTAFAPANKQVSVSATSGASSPITTTTTLQADTGMGRKPTYGEESRKFRRTVFGHDDWVKHRRPDRFLKNLFTIFDSGVTQGTRFEVSCVAGVATFIAFWNSFFYEGFRDLDGVLHDPIIQLASPLSLPAMPFTVSVSALALLITFRTNNAYQRWFECRQCWGIINTECRNIARMSCSWSVPAKERNREKRIEDMKRVSTGSWIFMRALQRHTGGPDDEAEFQATVRQYLPPDEAEGLIAANHRPFRALFNLSRHIERLPLTERQRIEVDKSCVIIGDICGACERIYGTPIPLVYTRHTSRFLSTWLLFLPFAMWEPFGKAWNHWEMVPASALVALFLFGIDELSIQLEEPFS